MRPVDCTYKFRANFTDGTRGIVKGMSTCDATRSHNMAMQIARRNNVQSVKVIAIPNNR